MKHPHRSQEEKMQEAVAKMQARFNRGEQVDVGKLSTTELRALIICLHQQLSVTEVQRDRAVFMLAASALRSQAILGVDGVPQSMGMSIRTKDLQQVTQHLWDIDVRTNGEQQELTFRVRPQQTAPAPRTPQ